MENFLNKLLAGMLLSDFFAYYLIALVAAIFMLLVRAENKRKTSPDTPVKFNLGFFFQDNILKFVINLLAIGFAIIFSNNIVGSEITGWASFLIGIGINGIVIKLQNLENKARD